MSAGRLPWHRRLSVRLGALIAVAILAFDQCAPYLFEGLGRLFHLQLGDEFYVNYDQGDLPEGVLVPEPVRTAARQLLSAMADEESARQQALQEELFRWRPDVATTFYITDDQLRVRSASPSLKAERGAPMRLSRREEAYRDLVPLQRGEAVVGWLCLVPPTPAAVAGGFAAELPGDVEVLSEAEAEARFERMEVVGTAVHWLLRAAIALTAGLCVSWLVTRRLARLAQAAREDELPPAIGDGAAVAGSDEIGALGVALAEARTRIGALVKELAARDVARREWIAQVSHDLRTPLTALVARLERMQGLAERLADGRAADADAVAVRESIEVALEDADRVASLARDLMEAARLELSDELVRERLLVGELLERVGDELQPLASNANLDLQVELHEALPSVDGDGNRLLRVLENLTRNALEHARSTVRLSASRDGDGVAIEVADDGPGLEGAGARSKRADSAGLGLQVARRILAAHGSSLQLRERDGGGWVSRFHLAATPG